MAAAAEFDFEGAFDFDAARRLPEQVRFGASSWKYPGWKGSVYRDEYRTKKAFESDCLAEYGRFPWFRCVGLDHSFYTPAAPAQLDRYAEQLPPACEWVSKAWEHLTIARFPRSRRYGSKAGESNPSFLDPNVFREQVLPAYDRDGIRERTGPFVFQLAPSAADGDVARFLDQLEAFLGALPTTFRYAVEVRDRELLQPRYFSILNATGASHCFNHWTRMPPLADQMEAAQSGGARPAFVVCRLLTPLGLAYQKSVERFAPYDRLQAEQPELRRDLVRLAESSIERDIPIYALVNNRVEGHSPGTIDALGRAIVEGREQGA